jgi:coatomer subunit beta
LESTDIAVKVKALKNAITGLLAGESMPKILMTVIRFCINSDDHQIKKLLMLYWEIVPKYSADNKLLPEMILVCNALRNDLNSPNEYIRGCMLRFLCKLQEPEILESLVPSIKLALDHRHAYVRRNAALAIYSIHKSFGEQLLPDGAELMEKFIQSEQDTSARRNAFLMLFNEAENIAIDFLSDHIDDIQKFGDGFALLVLELTRKVCRRDPAQKSRFVRCLFKLLRSDSNAVSYEAAWTLVSLSTAPTAVRACAQTYSQLLISSSDNNVKMIVLDRLTELKKHHSKVVQEMVMDILRTLNSPNIDICKKTLTLAIDLVGPRNIDEVVQVLKREVIKTQEADAEFADEYRQLLIQAIHKCATRFGEAADNIVLVLLDFIGGDGGYDVMQCVKSIIEQYPRLRIPILKKILSNFGELTNSDALRVAMWILSEYCDNDNGLLQDALSTIKSCVGEGPYCAATEVVKEETKVQSTTSYSVKNVVLADGTYGSVTSSETVTTNSDDEKTPNLRKLIVNADVLLSTVTCLTLTKLVLKQNSQSNSSTTSALSIIAGIGKQLESKKGDRTGVHADCLDRISLCVRFLLDPTIRAKYSHVFLSSSHNAYAALVAKNKALKDSKEKQEKKSTVSQSDDLIQFRQLRIQAVQGGIEVDLMDADDISRAIGVEGEGNETQKRLKHVHQLTGYSDPVYAEASVTVHDYDIIFEMTIYNRTPNTLTNLTVELATMGDLKLVERPQSYTIGPNDSKKVRANIKVSSTETGHIFGTIVFDNSSNAQKYYVNLNDIQLDIMDYIRPAECKHEEFRSMWQEFEWENKVVVNTNMTDLGEFVNHIVQNTNMTCLTSLNDSIVQGTNFLAANLYARSVFGEDALVNVSVERKEDISGSGFKLSGFVRIRSKTQGIALSLGDRITTVQRMNTVSNAQ